MANEGRGSGCLKVLTVGCGCLLVVALVLGGLISWNWKRMRGVFDSAVSTMSDLQDVQRALGERYGTGQVGVQRIHRSGTEGPALRIHLADAPFMHQMSEDAWGAQALAVAAVARDAYPGRDAIVIYEVVLTSHGEDGMAAAHTREYTIRAGDLPAPAATPEPTPALPSESGGRADEVPGSTR